MTFAQKMEDVLGLRQIVWSRKSREPANMLVPGFYSKGIFYT